MSESLYSILGVAKGASEAEIRKAYRKLAKQFHPDANPGDKKAEERFKRISAAYEILHDKDKRGRYDRGDIDEQGNERGFGFGAGQAGGARPGAGPGGFNFSWSRKGGPGGQAGGFGDMDDILSELFGGAARAGHPGAGRARAQGMAFRGDDVRAQLTVDFLDAAAGAKRRVTLPDGRSLEVSIPAGLESGQTLRLKGQGQTGVQGGPAGDLLVEVSVAEHPQFTRKGLDILSDQSVPLAKAVLGGKVRVTTIDGEVSLRIPKGSSSGRTMRLRGKGIRDAAGRHGDHLVRLMVSLPEPHDTELEAIIREWARRRGDLEVETDAAA